MNKPPCVTPLDKSPINRLFFAINHYVSTGDHIGEGVVLPEPGTPHRDDEPYPEDRLRFLIPVRTASDQDLDDFASFRSRFEELQDTFTTRLEASGSEGAFGLWSFAIAYRQADALAKALRRRPGPKGWGSPKATIDQANWKT